MRWVVGTITKLRLTTSLSVTSKLSIIFILILLFFGLLLPITWFCTWIVARISIKDSCINKIFASSFSSIFSSSYSSLVIKLLTWRKVCCNLITFIPVDIGILDLLPFLGIVIIMIQLLESRSWDIHWWVHLRQAGGFSCTSIDTISFDFIHDFLSIAIWS